MNYPEAVQYLLSLLGDIRSSNFGLQRMEKLMDQLDWPSRSFRVVHVAGTNGKGSTAAMVESGLRAAGLATGLYTSPHLIRFNERFRINGRDIADEPFAAAVDEVRVANDWLSPAEGDAQHATFFETVTAAAFCAFRRAAVDWAVVEVGLGGRLDATNVVQPDVAVITPIDFDHEAFLGKAAGYIAEEKAGVLKPGAKAITAPQRPQAMEVIKRRARELEIPLVQAGVDWKAERVTHTNGFYRFWAVTADAAGKSDPGVPIELPLAGKHQIGNALTAFAALEAVGVAPADIQEGVKQTEWPGRLEHRDERPAILLDAAHNPAGARALAEFLREHHAGRRIHLIYGAVRDKAVDEVAGSLFPGLHQVILTRARVPRSIRPETLRSILDHHHSRIETAATVEQAIDLARHGADPDDLILIAGSVFLVGEAKEILQSVTTKR